MSTAHSLQSTAFRPPRQPSIRKRAREKPETPRSEDRHLFRFLVIGQQYSAPTGNDKTSIVFGVKHKVGALYDALSVFKTDNINMTKIESRPSRSKAWEYYFFVDIDGHVEAPEVARALEELQEHCTLMTILGSYPKAEI